LLQLPPFVELAVGMQCGNGKSIEKWHNVERILIPTHDCANYKHYLEYNKWSLSTAKDFISDSWHEEETKETISHFKEITIKYLYILWSIYKGNC